MSDLDDIIDTLWLYNTCEKHPWTIPDLHAALKDSGDLVIDGLIWGLQQEDVQMRLMVFELLRDRYSNAKRVLPVVRSCIEEEDRLVRIAAICTAYAMRDSSPELVPLLTPKLDSTDEMERVVSAAALWRAFRSEDAYLILRQEAALAEEKATGYFAREYLNESESLFGPPVIHTLLDAAEFILEDQGEPQSPYWLASQMMEIRLWRASEHDVRAELEKDVRELGERSRFVKMADGEWGLREWGES